MGDRYRKLLLRAQLSESGRPVFEQNETERNIDAKVGIEFHDESGDMLEESSEIAGEAFITNFRFIWIHTAEVGNEKIGAFALPLAAVSSATITKRNFMKPWASPRLCLRIHTTSDGTINPRVPQSGSHTSIMSIVLRGSRAQFFIQDFLGAHKARDWAKDTSASAPGSQQPLQSVPRAFDTSFAGIDGLLRREQEQQKATSENLQEAFGDLKALMAKARDMVELAGRIRSKLNVDAAKSPEAAEEKQEIQDFLLSVGIASPVTRNTAGALYHQQLARQLSDFLAPPLQKAGGMLALVDVYCLFNRARGTELISPEDLLQACQLAESIKAPFKLRRFESGVMVVQSVRHNDDEIVSQLRALVSTPEATKGGVSARDAARLLGIAPALAKEELLSAEIKGVLCRDDSVDGLRFYDNFFMKATLVSS